MAFPLQCVLSPYPPRFPIFFAQLALHGMHPTETELLSDMYTTGQAVTVDQSNFVACGPLKSYFHYQNVKCDFREVLQLKNDYKIECAAHIGMGGMRIEKEPRQ